MMRCQKKLLCFVIFITGFVLFNNYHAAVESDLLAEQLAEELSIGNYPIVFVCSEQAFLMDPLITTKAEKLASQIGSDDSLYAQALKSICNEKTHRAKALIQTAEAQQKIAPARYCTVNALISFHEQDNKAAAEWIEKALKAIGPELERERATLFFDLGTLYWVIGKHVRAEECFRDAVLIYEKLRCDKSLAQSYGRMGDFYSRYKRNDPSQAIGAYLKAIEKLKTHDNKTALAECYYKLGWSFSCIGPSRHEEAIQYQLKALALYEELYNYENQVKCLIQMSHCYSPYKKYEEAILILNMGIDAAKKSTNLEGNLLLYSDLGEAYYENKQMNKASEAYEEAVILSEQIGDLHTIVRYSDRLAESCDAAGNLEKAVAMYEKSLQVRSQLSCIGETDLIFSRLGDLYQKLGQMGKAVEMHQKSLELLESEEGYIFFHSEKMARQYDKLSVLYQALREWDKAIEMYEKRLAIAPGLEYLDEEGDAEKCYQLCLIYKQKGNKVQVEKYCQKGKEYLRQFLEDYENHIPKDEADRLKRSIERFNDLAKELDK